jgi:hypothetical protein
MTQILRYAGFGSEAEYGVAVPATLHVDINSATLDAPSGSENVFQGGIGRALRSRRPGYYRPGGNVVYAWDIRTIAAMLRWTLGGYVFTAGGDNTHEVYGSNEVLMESFTTRIGKDVFEHVFAGCIVESLELDLGGDFLLATMAVGARRDSKDTLKEPSELLLPDEFPLAFHEVTMELPADESEDISPLVKQLRLTINNGLRADSGRSIGSRYPRRMPVGGRTVTGTMDLWYESTEQLERLWGGATGPTDDGSEEVSAKITADAGADGSLTLDLPAAFFTQVGQQGTGRDEITQQVQFQALEGAVTLADDSTEVLRELLATVVNGEDDLEGSS